MKSMMNETIKQQDELLEIVAAKLVEHDGRFDEHDKRFDEHDKRFDEHDRQFAKINEKLIDHDRQFVELRRAINDLVEVVQDVRKDTALTSVSIRRIEKHLGLSEE